MLGMNDMYCFSMQTVNNTWITNLLDFSSEPHQRNIKFSLKIFLQFMHKNCILAVIYDMIIATIDIIITIITKQ